MKLTVLTAVVGGMLLIVFLELLRRRRLREKYAVLWILVSVGVVPLAIFPRGLDRVANLLGVASGASLVLFLGLILLLLICTHLSWEVSQLEEETRTLSEEVALIRTELAQRAPHAELAQRAPHAELAQRAPHAGMAPGPELGDDNG